MMKHKYWLLGGVGLFVVAVGAAGGGFYLAKHQSAAKGLGASYAASKASQADDMPSSLSVGSADSLGQIGSQQTQSGGTTGANTTGGAGSGSGPKTINPATFAEYDKYKDSQNSLFGEIEVGTGAELGVNQKAAVYYKGWLTNGQLFDESKAGSDGKLTPFVFTLGAHAVIPGWEEGVVGMKVGGSRLIIVPPAAGYGAAGQGPVPANAVLVFQVQLLAVQ